LFLNIRFFEPPFYRVFLLKMQPNVCTAIPNREVQGFTGKYLL
jgi:hypothetical protein